MRFIDEYFSLFAVRTMNHIPPYLFLSREDDNDVREIEKHDLRLVLLHSMLSNTNRMQMSGFLVSAAMGIWE